jgi:hypothetical protein
VSALAEIAREYYDLQDEIKRRDVTIERLSQENTLLQHRVEKMIEHFSKIAALSINPPVYVMSSRRPTKLKFHQPYLTVNYDDGTSERLKFKYVSNESMEGDVVYEVKP